MNRVTKKIRGTFIKAVDRGFDDKTNAKEAQKVYGIYDDREEALMEKMRDFSKLMEIDSMDMTRSLVSDDADYLEQEIYNFGYTFGRFLRWVDTEHSN